MCCSIDGFSDDFVRLHAARWIRLSSAGTSTSSSNLVGKGSFRVLTAFTGTVFVGLNAVEEKIL